jgi:signal transduction histidine kinase
MTVDKPEGTPYLIQRLAAKLGIDDRIKLMPIGANGQRHMRLNYFDPSTIMTCSASDIIAGKGLQDLAGRTVLIGYVAFRPWTAYMLDATHLNSPWQNDGVEVDASSMPLVTLQAEALTNLLRTAWLEEVSIGTILLQGFLTVCTTLLFWRTTIGFACFLFIGGWASFIIVSSLTFAFLQLYIPLADSLIASVVAMAFGATLRLREEGKHRAAAEAAAASHAELASIQHRFLDRFTTELSSINRRVCDLIAFEPPAGATATLTTAHERMRSSCNELDEYLIGMEQLNSLDGTPRRRRPTLQPVLLAEVIQRAVRQFEARADESNIKFEVACTPDLHVFADDYLLRQILFNLVSNAVKYSPPRGTIHIHAFTEQKQARISVSDQGPGIAETFHEKIFEKFYRVKDDYVYKVKGHGLGLYLCRYFCEQIDASIDLSSTLGSGSTFTLTLRAAETKASR